MILTDDLLQIAGAILGDAGHRWLTALGDINDKHSEMTITTYLTHIIAHQC